MTRGLITLPVRAARKLKRILEGPPPPAIDISDEFTTWLQYANAGMLDRGNLYCFDYAIRNLPSAAPVFEIGSFCGLSTNAIVYYLAKHRARNTFFTCDRWDFENKRAVTVGESSLTHEEYRAFVQETFIRNVCMFSRAQLPNTIELSSDEFFSC